MTVELYALDAPNAVEFIIAWLRPLGDPCNATRMEGDPLPYRMVTRVAGEDDHDKFSDDAVVSVHTFAATFPAASDAADMTHRRIMVLIDDPNNDVTLIDNTIANAEYVETLQKPIHVDYEDPDVIRFVARYRLGLHFVAVQ